MKITTIVLGIIVFLVGFFIGIGTSGNKQQASKTTQAQTTNTNQADWLALKSADDKLITSCSESFGIVSDIFKAQESNDTAMVNQKNNDLAQHATEATNEAAQRNSALKKLGLTN